MKDKVDVLVDNWGRKFVRGIMTRETAKEFLKEMESVGVEYDQFVQRLDERHREFYN